MTQESTQTICIDGPLTRAQRVGLGVLVVLLSVLGCMVVMRSALMSRRMGDYDCFTRAGWAIRTGHDIYDVTDDNGFHYNYPPLFAILMAPLADPPTWSNTPATLPYWQSVLIWYLLSLFLLALGAHWLASALEQQAAYAPLRKPIPGGRRWWALRLLPVLACAAPLGHTLMRGQANIILLLCFCGLAACTMRGQSWRAGFCLSGAILLKVFPAFLLIYPLWRKDLRCLAGCSLGLLLGGLIIPAAVMGVPRTIASYQKFATVTLAPGLGLGHDQTRAKELIEATATDSQSLQVVWHNTLYPNVYERPAHPSEVVRWGARLIGGLLAVVTLLTARRRVKGSSAALLCGALVVVMLLLSPVCHLHYFSMIVPLIMALVMVSWETRSPRRIGFVLAVLMWANVGGSVLPLLPRLAILRDLGLTMYLVLAFWMLAVIALWRATHRTSHDVPTPVRVELAA